MRSPVRSCVFAAVVALVVPTLSAAVTLPAGTSVTIAVAGGSSYTLTGLGSATDLGDGEIGWTLNDSNGGGSANGVWSVSGILQIGSWSATLKEDPFVTNNLVITNVSSVAQSFTATVTLPIPGGFSYNQIIDSSIAVTVTDTLTTLGGAAGDGATISSVSPTGIYTGLINGSPALTLFPHPTTISCATNGCSVTLSDPVSGDFDGPAGPGVATSIALTLTFTLGPGDTAGITSRFEIIPEPGTLALVGGGLAALAALGRRARAA
jgi:hypothetical protein